MVIGESVNSKSTVIVTLLHVIVVINIYNLVIIKINNGDPATGVLLANGSQMIEILILWQTMAFICMIILNATRNTSCIIRGIKYCVIAIIYLTLLFDIMIIIKISNDLLYRGQLDEFWRITNREELTAPDHLYFFVAGILVLYSAIKIYALCAILHFAKKFLKGKSETVYLITITGTDRERNRTTIQEPSIPITPPPLYDECGIESNLPPSYNVA